MVVIFLYKPYIVPGETEPLWQAIASSGGAFETVTRRKMFQMGSLGLGFRV